MQNDQYFPSLMIARAAALPVPIKLCQDKFELPASDKYSFSVVEYPKNRVARRSEIWVIGFVARDHSFPALDGNGGVFEALESFVKGMKGAELGEYLKVWGVKYKKPYETENGDWYYWVWEVTFGVKNNKKI